jgi:hypothetical protein
MRVSKMCVGKSDGSITNFKYRGPLMAVEAGVPVGDVAIVSCGSLVPGTAWAIASGVVAGSDPSEIETTGPRLSIAQISEMPSALRSPRRLPVAKVRTEGRARSQP